MNPTEDILTEYYKARFDWERNVLLLEVLLDIRNLLFSSVANMKVREAEEISHAKED